MPRGDFHSITKEFTNSYDFLMKRGKLPMRSTSLGFWNAAIGSEVHSGFKKLRMPKSSRFIDLGSGDGHVTLIASLFFNSVTGVECDSELHEKAQEFSDKLGIDASFHNHDFFDHDLSMYDVVFVNPDKPMHRGLEDKLLKELTGKLVVYGHHFHPTSLTKVKEVNVDDNIVTVYTNPTQSTQDA